MLSWLRDDPASLRPLTVSEVQGPSSDHGHWLKPDVVIALSWKDKEFRFGVETKSISTPKGITAAIDQARRGCAGQNLNPMILVPYLSQHQLELLTNQELSGLDMCGNGVVIVPERLLWYRTGFPNKYPRNTGIRNIYRKESSIVARTFLLRPSFQSLGDVLQEIVARGGKVTLATVSKVCSELDNDLIIERKRETKSRNQTLRLLQPDMLLDRLTTHYVPSEVTRAFIGKWALSEERLRQELRAWAQESKQRVVLTGASSVNAYAVMAREPLQEFYCSDIESATKWLGDPLREVSHFANVLLWETRDKFAYFDQREDLLASPIQVYLELMTGDKRDQETAAQVRRIIMGAVRRTSNGEAV
jgi:hypothetical protein